MRWRSQAQSRGREHADGGAEAGAAPRRAPSRAGKPTPLCAGLLLCAIVLGGCSATRAPRTTRLADADLTQAVLDLRQQLADSRFLAERTTDSPEARLVLRRVENLSTDRIPVAEQWSLAARAIGDTGMQELLRSKHITMQLPPEKIALLERGGLDFPDLEPESLPTHLLTAQIASGTRAGSLTGGRDADIRKEYYLISFDIEDLQQRELLWQGSAELAREAEGTVVD
jgi:hypothetical protein